jgi:hypothetical protein
VIILPDLTNDNPDDEVLRIALTIRALLRDAVDRPQRKVRVVAKVIDANYAATFSQTSRTGIHEVICESDLGLRILAQTSISPGLTYVLKDLLYYSRDNSELYLAPIPTSWRSRARKLDSFRDVVDDAFSHAAGLGMQRGVIPVGYLRPKSQGGYTILINPKRHQWIESGFESYQDGDHLVVLAIDRSNAHEFLYEQHGGAGRAGRGAEA